MNRKVAGMVIGAVCLFLGVTGVQAREYSGVQDAESGIELQEDLGNFEHYTSGDYEYVMRFDEGIYLTKYLGKEETVIVPETVDGYEVRSIGEFFLYHNTWTKKVKFPKTVIYFANEALATAYALEEIELAVNDSEEYHVVDNVLYNGKQLVGYPAARKGECYIIPYGTTKIGYMAFYGMKYLKNLIVPSTVRNMSVTSICRSELPVDIEVRCVEMNPVCIDVACWEMAPGTRILVKNQELKDALIPQMTDKLVYKDHSSTIELAVAPEIPATSLTFADGKTENDFTLTYNEKGGEYGNLYDLKFEICQLPEDTTENVTWKVVQTDTNDAAATEQNPQGAVCVVSENGRLQACAGGDAVLIGENESGQQLKLHVKIEYPMESFYIRDRIQMNAGKQTDILVTIEPRKCYAATKQCTLKVEDTSIASLESGEENAILCANEMGETRLIATANDNGTTKTCEAKVVVWDYITNCTVDPVAPQIYTGSAPAPLATVRYRGRVLTEGKDYRLRHFWAGVFGKNSGCFYVEPAGYFHDGNKIYCVWYDVINPDGAADTLPSGSGTPDNGGSYIPGQTTQIPASGSQNPDKNSDPDTDSGKAGAGDKTKQNIRLQTLKGYRLKSGSGGITVSWKKYKKASGYQIVYGKKADLKKSKKTIWIRKNNRTSCRIKGLKSGKCYIVKIRPYRQINGKKYYGSWKKQAVTYQRKK